MAAVKASQQALQISLSTLAPAVLRTLLESSTFAGYTLEQDPSAPVLSIGGDIVLMFETESRIRPFVVLHATLIGPGGTRVMWAMRYAASVGAPRALTGDEGGWTVDGGAALQAVVSLEMQRALAVMFTDMSSPFVRDRNSKTTVQGYFPFIKGRFQVIGYLLGADANSIVFVPDVPSTSLLHGVQVMDKSITVFRPATADDPRMKSLSGQN
jgi:hypothetical protein